MKKGMLITVAGMALLAGTADVRAACIPTFCMEPQTCDYTYTAEACAANCLNPGSSSCVRNGTTYYQSCGSSKCSSGQTCSNGTCHSPVATSGYCCDDTYSYCGNSSSYNYCKTNWNGPDCSDMMASCRAAGGTPVFEYCLSTYDSGYARFFCQ